MVFAHSAALVTSVGSSAVCPRDGGGYEITKSRSRKRRERFIRTSVLKSKQASQEIASMLHIDRATKIEVKETYASSYNMSSRLSMIEYKLDILLSGYDKGGCEVTSIHGGISGEDLAKQCAAVKRIQRAWRMTRVSARSPIKSTVAGGVNFMNKSLHDDKMELSEVEDCPGNLAASDENCALQANCSEHATMERQRNIEYQSSMEKRIWRSKSSAASNKDKEGIDKRIEPNTVIEETPVSSKIVAKWEIAPVQAELHGRKVRIHINMQNGSACSLLYGSSTQLEHLMEHVCKQLKIDRHGAKFRFWSEEVKATDTYDSLRFDRDDVIDMMWKSSGADG